MSVYSRLSCWGSAYASEEDAMSDIKIQNSNEMRTEGGKPNILRALIGFALYMLLSPTLLFVSAGTLDWPMAWLYVILGFAAIGTRIADTPRSLKFCSADTSGNMQ